MSAQQAASNNPEANIVGFGISYAIASIFSAILVVFKESTPAVHDFLVAVTGHHWATHGVFNLIIFLVLGYILSARNIEMSSDALVKTVVGSTVLSGLIITGYFI